MRHMFTRWLPENLWPSAVDWLKKHMSANNLFDDRVLTYPRTKIIEVFRYTDDKHDMIQRDMVMPIQVALVLESIGPRPGLDPVSEALALKAVTQTLVHEAERQGIGELYFLCDDPDVVKFAEKHGFVRRQIACLQFKV